MESIIVPDRSQSVKKRSDDFAPASVIQETKIVKISLPTSVNHRSIPEDYGRVSMCCLDHSEYQNHVDTF